MIPGLEKITDAHRERLALVYPRQSSMRQVRQNRESTRRQLDLSRLPLELGWHPENVVLINQDLGHSASCPDSREGFRHLERFVDSMRAGLVLCSELSRISRNDPDWARIIAKCAVTHTMLGDEYGIYDPRDMNDWLLMAIKSMLGVFELKKFQQQLHQAKREKAQRGELRVALPMGYEYDEQGKIVRVADAGVRQTVELALGKLGQIGSVRGVVRWMGQNGVLWPRMGPRGRIAWGTANVHQLCRLYRHPFYAGAWVYGRTKTTQEIREGKIVRQVRAVARGDWRVLRDHHEAYMSWEQYEAHQAILDRNGARAWTNAAPRGGPVLSAGLVWCDRCGRRMTVLYSAKHNTDPSRRYATYNCDYHHRQQAQPRCQVVSTRPVDQAVSQAVAEALKPAQADVSAEIVRQAQKQEDRVAAQWEKRLQQARWEVEGSYQRYCEASDKNPLAKEDLEKRYNQKLEAAKRIETEYEAWKSGRREPLSDAQVQEAIRLADDLGALWNSEQVTIEERKRMLRVLIRKIYVRADAPAQRVRVRILWQGELETRHEQPWFPRGHTGRSHRPEVIGQVRAWAGGLSDSQIADRLNEHGMRTGTGREFTRGRVARLRRYYRIPSLSQRPPEPLNSPGQWIRAAEWARKNKMNLGQVQWRIRAGKLTAGQRLPGGLQWVWVPAPPSAGATGLSPQRSPGASLNSDPQGVTFPGATP